MRKMKPAARCAALFGKNRYDAASDKTQGEFMPFRLLQPIIVGLKRLPTVANAETTRPPIRKRAIASLKGFHSVWGFHDFRSCSF
jgi:hypothetical protein